MLPFGSPPGIMLKVGRQPGLKLHCIATLFMQVFSLPVFMVLFPPPPPSLSSLARPTVLRLLVPSQNLYLTALTYAGLGNLALLQFSAGQRLSYFGPWIPSTVQSLHLLPLPPRRIPGQHELQVGRVWEGRAGVMVRHTLHLRGEPLCPLDHILPPSPNFRVESCNFKKEKPSTCLKIHEPQMTCPSIFKCVL